MGHNDILLKTAKLLILLSIIYFLWATVSFDALRTGLSFIPFIGPLIAGSLPPVWFSTFNQTYYTALQNMTIKMNDSIINGTQLYLQDINASIVVTSNGMVYATGSSYTNDSDVMLVYFYNRVGWKYACINSLFLSKQICKNTYSDFSQQYLESLNTTMGMNLPLQEAQATTFIIPMDINGNGGILDSYNYTNNPSDDYLHNLLNTNPTGIYGITSDYETANAVINFNETATKCFRFAIPRFGRVRVNVTMPGPLISHVVPNQFLNESIIGNNYIYVDYNPYPCCGIPRSGKIHVEVCS